MVLLLLLLCGLCRGSAAYRLGSPDNRTPPGIHFLVPPEYPLDNCPWWGVTTAPVPDRCDAYFECVEGVEELKQCPSGLLYNPYRTGDAAPCDPPASATVSRLMQCTPHIAAFLPLPPCPAEGITTIHICGRADTYYVCANGKLELKKCREGWIYDFAQPNSTHPCQLAPSSYVSGYECPQEGGESEAVCPVEGKTTLPASGRCDAYRECVQGVEILKECPAGLLYNPDRALDTDPCDLATNLPLSTVLKCHAHLIALSPCPAMGVAKTSDNGRCDKYYACMQDVLEYRQCPVGLLYNPEQALSALPCELPFDVTASRLLECASQLPEKQRTHPIKDRCDSYYKCAKGGCEIKKCPSGLLYNPYHAENAEPCDDQFRQQGFIQNRFYDSDTRPQCSPDGSASAACIILCAEDTVTSTQRDVPGYCGGYFTCMQGSPTFKQCPAGLMYDPERGNSTEPCVPPLDLKVPRFLDCSPEIHDLLPCTTEGVMSLPDSLHCDAYYECWQGSRIKRECPDGQLYNLDLATNISGCDVPSNSEKYRLRQCSQELTERVMTHSIQSSCSIYFECFAGRCEVKNCPLMMVYNAYREKGTEPCVPPNTLYNMDPCFEFSILFSPTEELEECPPSGVRTLPGSSCHTYRQCLEDVGLLVESECPLGLLYNPARANDTEPCDHEGKIAFSYLLNCGGNYHDFIPDLREECPWEGFGRSKSTFPIAHRCDAYHECTDGVMEMKRCPEDLLYNPDRANLSEPCDHLMNLPFERFLNCSMSGQLTPFPYAEIML